MTHLVCGYPNILEAEKILTVLSERSEYVEIQFPFSDPIADWEVITKANAVALKQWIKTIDCFNFIEKNIVNCESDILIMTYYNVVLNYWVKDFILKAKKLWVYWLIIPDIPYDESDGIYLIDVCKRNNIHLIQVVSPNISEDRLKEISKISSWFIYAISQNITTWSKWEFWEEFSLYIKKLRNYINLPIWVWFWIKSKNDINKVCESADFIIIWSELIKKYNSWWIEKLEKYLLGLSPKKYKI